MIRKAEVTQWQPETRREAEDEPTAIPGVWREPSDPQIFSSVTLPTVPSLTFAWHARHFLGEQVWQG